MTNLLMLVNGVMTVAVDRDGVRRKDLPAAHGPHRSRDRIADEVEAFVPYDERLARRPGSAACGYAPLTGGASLLAGAPSPPPTSRRKALTASVTEG